jgi:hypothetical protein
VIYIEPQTRGPDKGPGKEEDMRYPEYLYETPEGWSQDETFWLSETELRRVVRELRKLNCCPEWKNISESDALPWRHIGGGVYEEVHYDPRVGPDRRHFRYDRERRSWFPVEKQPLQ